MQSSLLGCVSVVVTVCQTVKTAAQLFFKPRPDGPKIYGNINPMSDFEQLCEGIAGYSNEEDGIVPWKHRVALFRENSIARIPPKAKTD